MIIQPLVLSTFYLDQISPSNMFDGSLGFGACYHSPSFKGHACLHDLISATMKYDSLPAIHPKYSMVSTSWLMCWVENLSTSRNTCQEDQMAGTELLVLQEPEPWSVTFTRHLDPERGTSWVQAGCNPEDTTPPLILRAWLRAYQSEY